MKFNDLAVKRYTDAYKSPKSLLTAGKAIKAYGGVFSLFVFLVGMSYGGVDGFAFFVISLFFGFITYGLGAMISAQGQILCAALDAAVNTSPFMSAQERADVMSLTPQRTWDSLGISSIQPANGGERVAEKVADHQPSDFPTRLPLESPVAALIAEAQMVETARSPRSGRRPSRYSGRRWY